MNNHRLYDIWNQVPVTYYQEGVRRNVLQRIWHGIKRRDCIKTIRVVEFKNCLDVGCASGYMISNIARAYPGRNYYGVDAYDRAINYATSRYPSIVFKTARADKLPFPKNTFDLVIFYETIEHVENPRAALREIKRVLKKNGTLVLAMDSGNWAFRTVWAVWENTYGRVWRNAHLHPLHHTELETLIKRSGFKIRSKHFTHLGMEVVFVLSW